MRLRRTGAALAVLAIALAGCGGDGAETDSEPVLAQQAAPSTAPVSAAESLPPPAAVPVPMNAAPPPPAPSGGPPPRAPRAAGSSAAGAAIDAAAAVLAPTLARSVFARGLEAPQDLAFAPDGTLFYTERTKGLAARRPSGVVQRLFAPKDLAAPSGAMFGVAVDPQFALNRYVYVFMIGGSGDARVVRLQVDAAYAAVTEQTTLVAGIAAPPARAGEEVHAGGALRFGADGWLYVAIGDLLDPNAPQGAATLAGKLLRIDRDGRPAPGNHAPPGFDARVFAYGLRNPTALALPPGGAAAWVGEDGAGQDEITRFAAGGNGGWDPRCPIAGVNSAAAAVKAPAAATGYCGKPAADRRRILAAMTDLGRHPGATPPLWTNLNRAQGLAALEFLRGQSWKSWHGALAVAYAGGPRIDVLRLNAGGGVEEYVSMLGTLEHPVRALALGPDGALYVATNGRRGGDEIWRIEAR
jgi:glucose/arabinose dehydrogenase